MDYGKLLRRSWDILVKQKYLIILGVLAALGNSGSNSYNWQNSGGSGSDEALPSIPTEGFDFQSPPFEGMEWLWLLPVAALVALIGFAILIGILIWVVSVMAQGGLIAGVNGSEQGEPMSFGQAWGAAWARGWRLLGISLLPAIPMLIFLALGIATFISTIGLAALSADNLGAAFGAAFGTGIFSLFLCLVCVLVPVWIVLEVLRIFAMRACLLENTGVFDAYRRGVQVIRENGTEFFALLLLRVAVGVVIGVVLFVPGLAMTICCILWPLLLLIKGAIAAYFSTLWTLAWREWTGMVAPPQLPDAATEA